MRKLGEFISQAIPEDVMAGANGGAKDGENTKDFTLAADIFDLDDSYIIYLRLVGAKKEGVAVNWDADKSELNIVGVIHRPRDEPFLKTLALNKHKADSDAISAKMEDGILMITIPKVESIVEVKKVDIE
ncbi:hypothetical protein MMC21_004220 [Puttea exsequens]|nr:hypothetical protein [Puttea exsequens]